jgi:hypothetical protein
MATTDTERSTQWEPKHALRRNPLARSEQHQELVKDLLARHSSDEAHWPAEKTVDGNTDVADIAGVAVADVIDVADETQAPTAS